MLKDATLGMLTHSTTTTTTWLLKTPAQNGSAKAQTTYRNSSNYNENKTPLPTTIIAHQGTCTEWTPNPLLKIPIRPPKSNSNALIRTNYRKNYSLTSIKRPNHKISITYQFSPTSYRQYQNRKNSTQPNLPINPSKQTLQANSSKPNSPINSTKTSLQTNSCKRKLKLPLIHSITYFRAVS